jgi:hypothetical protein
MPSSYGMKKLNDQQQCKAGYTYQTIQGTSGCFRNSWPGWSQGASGCTAGNGWAPDGGVGCADSYLVPDTQSTVSCPLNQAKYGAAHFDCMQDNSGNPLWTNCPYATPYDPNVLWVADGTFCNASTTIVNPSSK